MKRLLAYLFIVLGLGLMFNVSANASSVKYSYDKDFVCFQIINETVFVGSSKGGWATKTDRIESICSIFVYKDYHPKEYSKITNYWPHLHESKDYFIKNAVHDYFIKSLKLNKKKFSKILHKKTKINLAKNEENLIIFKSLFVNRKNKNQYWGYSDINEKISKRLALYKCEKSITNNETDCILKSSYSFYRRTNDKEHIAKVRADKNLLAKISSKDQKGESKTQIAKAEPTIKPKKKAKVAKKEPKQEEFKPKKTNQDNEAPVIQIAQNITVSDTSYVIEGKVSDKSDKIFVEIDGQPIEVKKGIFKAKRYSPVDEQVKIVAIDQWGNKSKPKLVNIKINIEETFVAENLEPLNPSNIRTKSSNDKIAIIIGIENYSEAPKANYANLDAQYFFDYARKAFGVKKQNINLLINEEATVVKTDKALSLWLKSKIKKNRSDLIIFFAGHGLASTDGKELYLLPQDGNPDRLERTALSRTDLFKEIISLNPKSVTMFLDTCYSGVSRDEQMLLASARPIRIVADEQDSIPNNFTIFSASKLDQISSGLKEAKHGIFSYYLMRGLEGYADFNEDKNITNGELIAYMDENVSQKAAEQGRKQNPSLAGDPNKVLMSYR